jgi:hypothetical protein
MMVCLLIASIAGSIACIDGTWKWGWHCSAILPA